MACGPLNLNAAVQPPARPFRVLRPQFPTAPQITLSVTTTVPASRCGNGRWSLFSATTAGFTLKLLEALGRSDAIKQLTPRLQRDGPNQNEDAGPQCSGISLNPPVTIKTVGKPASAFSPNWFRERLSPEWRCAGELELAGRQTPNGRAMAELPDSGST
jgi:hypothetical protein